MKKIILVVAILIIAVPAIIVIVSWASSLYTECYHDYMVEAKEADGYLVDSFGNVDEEQMNEFDPVIASKAFLTVFGLLLGSSLLVLFLLVGLSLTILIFVLNAEEALEALGFWIGIGILAGGTYAAYKMTKEVVSGVSNALPDNAKTALAAGAAAATAIKAVKKPV